MRLAFESLVLVRIDSLTRIEDRMPSSTKACTRTGPTSTVSGNTREAKWRLNALVLLG